MRRLLLMQWTVAALCISLAGASADDFASQRQQVLALAELTDAPNVHPLDAFSDEDGLLRIFFDALPWHGKPTRVFAWLGIPQSGEGKMPGIVLVHGGGGTAFKEWVQKWNDHGFAAISIAVEGQIDQREPSTGGGRPGWKSHAWPGPKRIGIYADSAEPLREQWMYHAVADTILANSLLRAVPEVDPDKVGLMGISWGGVITSTVMGIDDRFAFAIPTYGCGHLADVDNQWGRALGTNATYRRVWDPLLRMERAQMPALWLSWSGDSHFPLDAQAACYRAAPGLRMISLPWKMGHSHPAGWKPSDSYAFAESVVRTGKPWCRQTSLHVDEGVIHVKFASAKPLDKAVLVSTTDTGFTGDRNWLQTPADLQPLNAAWEVTAALPAATTAWFVNVRSDDLTVSSEYQEAE